MVNRLEKMFEETDQIQVQSHNICINCGASLENDYTTRCTICGYDSAECFGCPYKIKADVKQANGIPLSLEFCEITRKQCKVEGLDYEVCPTLRSLDYINRDNDSQGE